MQYSAFPQKKNNQQEYEPINTEQPLEKSLRIVLKVTLKKVLV